MEEAGALREVGVDDGAGDVAEVVDVAGQRVRPARHGEDIRCPVAFEDHALEREGIGPFPAGEIAGLVHAHFEGTASARRSAAVAPIIYHLASMFGVLYIFGRGLNPAVAPQSTAAGMHGVYSALFVWLYYLASDDKAAAATRISNKLIKKTK